MALTAEHINLFNYRGYAARYGAAGVLPPPPQFIYIGITLAPKDGLGAGISFSLATKDFLVPAGYQLSSYSAVVSAVWIGAPKFNLQVLGDVWEMVNSNVGGGRDIVKNQIGDFRGSYAYIAGDKGVSVPISIAGYDILAFALDVQGVCTRTPEAMAAWQLDRFGKIQTAYQALQTSYH